MNLRRTATVLLALTGIGVMIYYESCVGSCSYLSGDLLGIDLQYVGIAFMAAVAAASVFGFERLLRIMLASGIGGEVFLVGYQFQEGIFCPYCLVFGVALILAFLVNHRRGARQVGWRKLAYALGEIPVRRGGKTEPIPLTAFMLLNFFFFAVVFNGSPVPSYAAETFPSAFGNGPIEIRIYSDYFCPPCQRLEDGIESVLDRIVAQNKARILFIDTPGHRETPLYAQYFHRATADGGNYGRAKAVRRILFQAAREGVKTEDGLVAYLRSRGIQALAGSTAGYFQTLSRYIKDDRVRSTPTCVVISPNEGRSLYSGNGILEALKKIAGT